MSKYKVGDKIVMEITKIFSDNFGTKDCIVKGFTRCDENCLNEHSEPLSTYTLPLEDKIRRQAEEITRLLIENKELKAKYDVLKTSWDDCEEKVNDTCNTARAEGHSEAWELARKIVIPNGYSNCDLNEIFGSSDLQHVLENYTYTEATAKVAEWRMAKEEIKVGDVVSHEEKYEEKYGVVISEGTICFRGFTDDGTPFEWYKERCTKTGRHIDIDSFLKQIGEEQE